MTGGRRAASRPYPAADFGAAALARTGGLAALVALAFALGASAAHAQDWDAQLSTRLMLGAGAQIPEQGAEPWPMMELGLRADLLFGEARPGTVRLGPAVDFRTEDFATFEAAGALALFLPTGIGFGFTATGGAGWGARPGGRDGAFGLAQIALGYRPYNYFSAYGYALGIYAGARVQVEPDPRAWEITVGVEVDLEFIFAIPFMFFVELARARDPFEEMEPDAPE